MPFVKTLPVGDDVFVVSKWSDTCVEKTITPIQGSRMLQGYNFEKEGGQVVIDSSRVAGGSFCYSMLMPEAKLSEVQDGFLKENVQLRTSAKETSAYFTAIYSQIPSLLPSALNIRFDDKGFQRWKLSGLQGYCSLASLNPREVLSIDVDKLLGKFQEILALVDTLFGQNPDLLDKKFMPITPDLIFIDQHENFRLILLPNDNALIDPNFEGNDVRERSEMAANFCYLLFPDYAKGIHPTHIEYYSSLQQIKHQLAMCYLAFRLGQNEPLNKDTVFFDTYFEQRLRSNPPAGREPLADRAAIDVAKKHTFTFMSIMTDLLHNRDNELARFFKEEKLSVREIDVLIPYFVQEPCLRLKRSLPAFFNRLSSKVSREEPCPDSDQASSDAKPASFGNRSLE